VLPRVSQSWSLLPGTYTPMPCPVPHCVMTSPIALGWVRTVATSSYGAVSYASSFVNEVSISEPAPDVHKPVYDGDLPVFAFRWSATWTARSLTSGESFAGCALLSSFGEDDEGDEHLDDREPWSGISPLAPTLHHSPVAGDTSNVRRSATGASPSYCGWWHQSAVTGSGAGGRAVVCRIVTILTILTISQPESRV